MDELQALLAASGSVIYELMPGWGQMLVMGADGTLEAAAVPFGDWMQTVVPDDERSRLSSAMAAGIATGQPFDLEHRVRRADGSVGWFHTRSVPVLGADGAVVRWLGTAHDISDHKRAEHALRDSERRLRLALDLAQLGTWNWDLVTGAGDLDERGGEIVGLPPGTVDDIGSAQRGTIHPDDLLDVEAKVSAGIAQAAPFTLDYRVVKPDGSVRYIDSRALVVTDAAGHVVGLTGTNRDVTHERVIETALRDSQAHHSFLVQLADVLAPLVDAGDIQGEACRVLGEHLQADRVYYAEIDTAHGVAVIERDYRRGDVPTLVGAHPLSAFANLLGTMQDRAAFVADDLTDHPDIPPSEHASYRERRIAAVIAVPLIKDGELVSCLSVTSATPRHWLESEIDGAQEVAGRTWATLERARAEAAVHRAESQLQTALDASHMGTFDWDVAGSTSSTDVRTLRLVGLPSGASLDHRMLLDILIHPDDRQRMRDALHRTLDPDGRDPLRQDVRVVKPDGTTVWIEMVGQAQFADTPARATRLVGVMSEITARKLTEAALRDRESELREASRRKDEFIAMLAHELRNPLAPIRTGLELIRLGGDTPAAVNRVRTMMERQVRHMVRLIDDLLDVSRITSGKIALHRQAAAVGDLVASAVEANRAAFERAGIELRVRLPETSCVVDVDPTRMVQVLSNLLHNATKFTPAGGHVDVSARAVDAADGQPATIVIAVADDGIGITSEMLPRVFELFVQGEDTRGSSQPGLGIGLALARQLVDMHGGRLEALSRGAGRGSTFLVTLALSPDAPARLADDAAAVDAPVRGRALIIDDNEDAAASMAMLIEHLGGAVRVAHDGESGLEEVRRFHPDVILLDIGMPRQDGYETCRRIRALPGGQSMHVVAVTGWGQEQDKQRASDAGFDAHLTKPVDPMEMGRLLTAAARPRAGRPSS